mmetsp:Transcript_125318/g.313093  ORF Transcript_125318/g.313093 Transcript_125318/m.313093 type:complete len:235 (-) Transcript_125318:241-945(-)
MSEGNLPMCTLLTACTTEGQTSTHSKCILACITRDSIASYMCGFKSVAYNGGNSHLLLPRARRCHAGSTSPAPSRSRRRDFLRWASLAQGASQKAASCGWPATVLVAHSPAKVELVAQSLSSTAVDRTGTVPAAGAGAPSPPSSMGGTGWRPCKRLHCQYTSRMRSSAVDHKRSCKASSSSLLCIRPLRITFLMLNVSGPDAISWPALQWHDLRSRTLSWTRPSGKSSGKYFSK